MRGFGRLIALVLLAPPLAAQQAAAPDLSLDAIFGRNEFAGAPMPEIHWLPDGVAWVSTRANPAGGSDIIRVEAATGAVTVLLDAARLMDSAGKRLTIEGLVLSATGTKALVFHDTQRVWRINTKGVYHVVDFSTGTVTPLSRAPGLQMFAKFSPNAEQAAFVRENNLVVADLARGTERALTQDGSDVIINGTSDWVYEEELGIRDAFRWSPDGARIAFYRFDQSPVPQYPLLDQSAVHARVNLIRYPQPGDPNSHVKIGVVEIATGHTLWIGTEFDADYIATMEWADADSLAIQVLARLQNRIDLFLANARNGNTRRLLVETDPAWLELDRDAPHWLAGGKMFLWPSERSGWRRYYLYSRTGDLIRPLTPDSADAQGVAGIAAKSQEIFVTEAAPGPTERQVFSYMLTRKPERVRVTTEPGTHAVDVSPSGRLYVDIYSAAGVPRSATLRELASHAVKRALETNAALRDNLARQTRKPEFFQIPMPDGTKLNAWRIVAPTFDSTKPHAVLMYVYGTPNGQTVVNSYGGNRELWHQLLARDGYVVVSVDNRGTGARGSAFRHIVYQKLGQLESQDQIDAAKWVAQRPWADPTRIGMWGWSGGGYLTSLTLSRGGRVFRSGIAVAPVTDWRLYDDIYTERYMRTPAENPEGYKNGSVLTYATGLTARLLLVHGTSDDNVHPQNTFWLANLLQATGIQFDLMLYPGRTHSITGGNTQRDLYTRMTEYLNRTLAAGQSPSSR